MDIEFFHNVFATVRGYVYQYKGSLDGIESVPHHVTDRFVALNNNPMLVSSVVEVKPGLAVLYTSDLYPDNSEFVLMHDLLIKPPEGSTAPPEEAPPTE
jgi:hypothetical protein